MSNTAKDMSIQSSQGIVMHQAHKTIKALALAMLAFIAVSAWGQAEDMAERDPTTPHRTSTTDRMIAEGSITSFEIGMTDAANYATGSITTDKLIDASFNGGGGNAISTFTGALATEKLMLSGDITSKLLSEVMFSSETFIDDAFSGMAVVDGTLTADHFASGTVLTATATTIDLMDIGLTAEDLGVLIADVDVAWFAANTLNSDHIEDDSVTGAEIAGMLSASKINRNDGGGLGSDNFDAGVLMFAHLAEDFLDENSDAALLADDTVSADAIVDGSLTTRHLADDAVTSTLFATGTLFTDTDEARTKIALTGMSITDESIVTAKFADDAVTGAALEDGTIVTAQLAMTAFDASADVLTTNAEAATRLAADPGNSYAATISADSIADDQVTNEKIATGGIDAMTSFADDAIVGRTNVVAGQIYGSARSEVNLDRFIEEFDGTGLETLDTATGLYMSHIQAETITGEHIAEQTISGYDLNFDNTGVFAGNSVHTNLLFESYYGEDDTTAIDTAAVIIERAEAIMFANTAEISPESGDANMHLTNIIDAYKMRGVKIQDHADYAALEAHLRASAESNTATTADTEDYERFQTIVRTLDINAWTKQEVGRRTDELYLDDDATQVATANDSVEVTRFQNQSLRAQNSHLFLLEQSLRGRLGKALDVMQRASRGVSMTAALKEAYVPYGSRGGFSASIANYADSRAFAINLAARVGTGSLFTLSAATNNDGEESIFRVGYDVSW